MKISIVIPAYNEADGLSVILPRIKALNIADEILVINDGSTDNTLDICKSMQVNVISHPYTMGNGASVKTGAREATGNLLVFMDGDGQHSPEDIPVMLERINEGFDMVVGARSHTCYRSIFRKYGNYLYAKIASLMTGYNIKDLTSGFRVVKADLFRKYLYLLPNRFSYPTTITMAFFKSGFPVAYQPIKMEKDIGDSHINIFKDGFRFFLIILKVGALFSPMRFFLPISFCLALMALSYYGYTYHVAGRFTNMGALLFLSSLFTFLIGMLAELVSALHYKDAEKEYIHRKFYNAED